MSIQLQSTSTVLSVSPEKTKPLTAIKNEPLESEIGIDDIPNSLDEEIIPDIKDIDIVSHELSEDLIKSETVSENIFENNHSGSVETQVFVKTENISLIKTENITQSEYLYMTQDISDRNVSRGTSQGVIQVQGEEDSNEIFNALQSDKQFVNFFKGSSDISRKAKCPNKTAFSKCYKTVETTSWEKDRRKGKVIEVPVIPIEPHKYPLLAKTKHTCDTNKSIHKQNKKSYCCDKCKYKTCWPSGFKRHKLMHLKPEEVPYFYCYHCPYKCKQKCPLKKHIFNHFKKEEVPFHCYICDFTTLERNLIIEHFKKHPKHHSKYDETDYINQVETYTKYRCDKCKYKTCLSGHFKRHKLKHLQPEEIRYFYCYHCPYKCRVKGNLKIHIFNHFKKQEVSFYCYICDFTTLERNLIIEHFKKHPKHHSKCVETDYKNQVETYTRYRCDKCKFKTWWSSLFKIHKLMHLKPEEIPHFYCYHCPYKCKQKGTLKRHIFNHFKKEEVPFHCYICDFTTLERNLIIRHFKKHPKHHNKCDETDYKNQFETYTKYRCDKCKYRSCWLSGFKTHKLKHLKPEQIPYFYCYHCPYKCKIKYNLQKHIFRHFKNEDVAFRCYICDFTTLKRDLIIEHFKKHPKHHSKCDETYFKNQFETYAKYHCDKCKYKTCLSGNFKRHKLKHLKPEEIPYFYCYHCPYKCKQKCPLKKHIFNHFKKEEVPFHCYLCDFVTLKRDLIIKHFKTHPKHHSKCDETDYKNQLETYIKY